MYSIDSNKEYSITLHLVGYTKKGLFLVTPLAPGILRWLLHFLKIWTHGLDPLGFRFLCHYPVVFLARLDVSKA